MGEPEAPVGTDSIDAAAKRAGLVAPGDVPAWLHRVAVSVRQFWVDEPATVVIDEDGVGDAMPTADELDLIALSLSDSLEAVDAELRAARAALDAVKEAVAELDNGDHASAGRDFGRGIAHATRTVVAALAGVREAQ